MSFCQTSRNTVPRPSIGDARMHHHVRDGCHTFQPDHQLDLPKRQAIRRGADDHCAMSHKSNAQRTLYAPALRRRTPNPSRQRLLARNHADDSGQALHSRAIVLSRLRSRPTYRLSSAMLLLYGERGFFGVGIAQSSLSPRR